MNINSALQIGIYFLIILLLTKPMGLYMYYCLEGKKTFITPIFRPIEVGIYKITGIKEDEEMNWSAYAKCMLIFSFVTIIISYILLRLQQYLPLNPKGFGTNEMTSDLAFNTSVSFSTNTNWQSYSPEATLSYFSNMISLAIHNWLSAAIGIATAIAVVRGFAKELSTSIGNFWVDVTRSIIYILLPLSLIGSFIFVFTGVPQNFSEYQTVQTLEGATQVIPQGPVASQEIIKQLGTNGGGFFNANSAHPYENPTPFSNLFSMLLIFLIPAGLTYTFGKMVKNSKQGWSLFAAMSVLFIAGVFICTYYEQSGNPNFTKFHIDQTASDIQPGGNMEGKDTRFGIASSTLFATITTSASCGAVNSMHDSYTPIGGLVLLFNILTSEVIFGGVGAGLYGILTYVILAVFIAGLMVGRTPEYLGKSIARFEIQMIMLSLLIFSFSILFFTALSLNLNLSDKSTLNRVANTETYLGATTNNLNNSGAHGFTEMLYAYTSGTGNNGSAFAGITANTPYYNITLALCMLIGRFFMIIPLLALAGSVIQNKKIPFSSGTFPTDTLIFIFLLVGTIIIVGALTFFPAMALGPIVEHFKML